MANIMLKLILHNVIELKPKLSSKGYPLSLLGEAWWIHTDCILAFLLQQTEGWCWQAFVHGTAWRRKKGWGWGKMKRCYRAMFHFHYFYFTLKCHNSSASAMKVRVSVDFLWQDRAASHAIFCTWVHMPKHKTHAGCIKYVWCTSVYDAPHFPLKYIQLAVEEGQGPHLCVQYLEGKCDYQYRCTLFIFAQLL